MAADKRVTRALYAAFIALAAAFIVTSVVDVAKVLFGREATGAARPHVSAACADAVAALASAVDRAAAAAAAAPEPRDAERAYSDAKKPEWDPERRDALSGPCRGDPNGPAALAAVARFDRAAEAWIRRRATELSPVRREVDSFIR